MFRLFRAADSVGEPFYRNPIGGTLRVINSFLFLQLLFSVVKCG